MARRIQISLGILTLALLIGLYLPADLVRRPPGTAKVVLPNTTNILSCYALKYGPTRLPFQGQSHFGKFWSWRRGLDKYDGLNLGPRDTDLEKLNGINEYTSYLVYAAGNTTNAIVYDRAAGWTSGAILGQLVAYTKASTGLWRETESYKDTSDSAIEAIYRMKIILTATACGILIVTTWNIARSRRRPKLAR